MTETSTTEPSAAPQGLDGWLILPIIGTVVHPFILAYITVETVIVAVDAAGLNSSMVAMLWIEIIVSGIFMLAYVYANVLLFRKNYLFPKMFIALAITGLMWTVMDILIALNAFDIRLTSSDHRDIARQVWNCLIWVPYMLVSKRVKNTFVER